jgi:hypothetical protein
MPFTVSENQIGQLWTFAELSRLNTSGGEGVRILHNEEFEVPFEASTGQVILGELPEYESVCEGVDKPSKKSKKAAKKAAKKNKKKSRESESESESGGEETPEALGSREREPAQELPGASKRGLYTRKDYYMASKFPWYVRKVLPTDLATLHESSWNMYPTVKTVLTNDYFKSQFRISIDTVTRAVGEDGQCEHNVHGLTEEQLANRDVIVVDIAEPVEGECPPDEDPAQFRSAKTGRGPLQAGHWFRSAGAGQQPLICVYKLVTVEFKVFGLQTRVEAYMKNMYRKLFTDMHRQIFCWTDKWYGLRLEDVREIERELQKKLETQIQQGEISKTALAASD